MLACRGSCRPCLILRIRRCPLYMTMARHPALLGQRVPDSVPEWIKYKTEKSPYPNYVTMAVQRSTLCTHWARTFYRTGHTHQQVVIFLTACLVFGPCVPPNWGVGVDHRLGSLGAPRALLDSTRGIKRQFNPAAIVSEVTVYKLAKRGKRREYSQF